MITVPMEAPAPVAVGRLTKFVQNSNAKACTLPLDGMAWYSCSCSPSTLHMLSEALVEGGYINSCGCIPTFMDYGCYVARAA